MRARVVSIESGSVFTDHQRRITIQLADADSFHSRIQLSESALGIAGLKLDDELDVGFTPVKLHEELAGEGIEGGVPGETGSKMNQRIEIEKLVFESPADRGFTMMASYLKPPNGGDALIEIFKEGEPLRWFLFPAYKIWNIVAHFSDMVDSELRGDKVGYDMAAWTGFTMRSTTGGHES